MQGISASAFHSIVAALKKSFLLLLFSPFWYHLLHNEMMPYSVNNSKIIISIIYAQSRKTWKGPVSEVGHAYCNHEGRQSAVKEVVKVRAQRRSLRIDHPAQSRTDRSTGRQQPDGAVLRGEYGMPELHSTLLGSTGPGKGPGAAALPLDFLLVWRYNETDTCRHRRERQCRAPKKPQRRGYGSC